MKPEYITPQFLNTFVQRALEEDIGDGDHSTLASIPADAVSRARLLVKQPGIIAGVQMAVEIFKRVDTNLHVDIQIHDGQPVAKGDVAFIVSGPSRSILTAERLVLNCMQRMSAIATKTKEFATLIQGTKAKLLDTRKTTPGLRMLEKYAVACGGGVNHRSGI